MDSDSQTETVKSRSPPCATRSGTSAARWGAALVLMVCGSALALAAWLTPDPRGYGTHKQLGSGECGFIIVTGYPCPTCGMTTAFCHTVRGHWIRAFWVQPAGFVFALATIAGVGFAVGALVTGRWPPRLLALLRRHHFFVALLALLLGGWAIKLAAGLLSGTLPTH